MGICHSYAPDGRCISLLKILLTNFCIYDCRFCINRASSNVERARFSPQEVVTLTLDFYKRNYIEGLFLSSGIIRSEDYTMEQLVEVARILREEHRFGGYIHLKTIAGADPGLIALAGLYADRLSTNVELPTEAGLQSFAPEKKPETIRKTMASVRVGAEDAIEAAKSRLIGKALPPRFAPAGQSTQMIVGADAARDDDILKTATNLYSGYQLRRVYYSAYSPIPDASQRPAAGASAVDARASPVSGRLALALLWFRARRNHGGANGGMLDLAIDPKLAWALMRREAFPVDINRAPRELLLRVPGLGTRAVDRIVAARRLGKLRLGRPREAHRVGEEGLAVHRHARLAAGQAHRQRRPARTFCAAGGATGACAVREVVLATPGDFAEWRSAARGLLAGGIAPEDVSWRGSEEGASLFGDEGDRGARGRRVAAARSCSRLPSG